MNTSAYQINELKMRLISNNGFRNTGQIKIETISRRAQVEFWILGLTENRFGEEERVVTIELGNAAFKKNHCLGISFGLGSQDACGIEQ